MLKVILLACGFVMTFIVSKYLRRFWNRLNSYIYWQTMPVNMLMDHRRNFEYILLGSSQVWSTVKKHKSDVNKEINYISFARPGRSLNGDWFVLQRMHSYLRNGGTVVLPLDISGYDKKNCSLGYSEICMLHPVTLKSIGLKAKNAKLLKPVLYYNKYARKFILEELKIRLPFAKKYFNLFLKRKVVSVNLEKRVENALPTISQINKFCMERSLHIIIVILIPERTTQKEKKNLKKILSFKLNRNQYFLYKEADEILEIFR